MVRTPPADDAIVRAIMEVSDALKVGPRSVVLFPLNLSALGVLPEDIGEGHFLEALRRYGEAHRAGRKEQPKPKPAPQEPRLLGVVRSTLLQWMGSEAWPEDDADVVLAELGHPLPIEEISAGLEVGRKSGERFDLPDHVIERLNEIRG